MVWPLLQVRKLGRTPLVLVGRMWEGLVDWARTAMLRPGLALADAADIAIPRCVGTVEETVAIIRENREGWLREQAARGTETGEIR